MMLDELPENIRIRLHEQDENDLWNAVERTGLKEAAERTGFEASRISGWNSRDLFVPAGFAAEFVEPGRLKALKGGGRAEPMEEVRLPIEVDAELGTRAELSVSVNQEGVPVYQTPDRENLRRFASLLEELGSPFSVYERRTLELRYPKYVHSIIRESNFESVLAAEVDEHGGIEDGGIMLEGREIDPADLEHPLHSSLRLELALQNGSRKEISSILAEKASEAREFTD